MTASSIWAIRSTTLVNHSNNEFAVGSNHINGIEGFWGFAKIRLVKFRGMRKSTRHEHLEECELDSIIEIKIYTLFY